jgi:hypothetical protein
VVFAAFCDGTVSEARAFVSWEDALKAVGLAE